MKFNEQIAKEVIEKFNLNEKTFRVWKNRDSIPDRYREENYHVKEKATIVISKDSEKANTVITNRIINVLKCDNIHTTAFSQLTNVDLMSVAKGNRRLSDDEIIVVKKEINRLKSDIVNTFATKNIPATIKLLKDKRIKPYTLIEKTEMKRILYREDIYGYEYQKIKDAFFVLVLKLNIN
jgi:hypothetical protein